MNPDFKQASTRPVPAKNQLVFVSNFFKTLTGRTEGNRNSFVLLQLLNDAYACGHRVIVTSKSHLRDAEYYISVIHLLADNDIYDLRHVPNFEVVSKSRLNTLLNADGTPLHIDYIFDNDPVDYAKADMEIRVGPHSGTTPLTLDEIRLSFIIDSLQQVAPNLESDREP